MTTKDEKSAESVSSECPGVKVHHPTRDGSSEAGIHGRTSGWDPSVNATVSAALPTSSSRRDLAPASELMMTTHKASERRRAGERPVYPFEEYWRSERTRRKERLVLPREMPRDEL